MNLEQQIPRNALVWIIICLFTLVAPHAGRLPIWVLLVYVLAVIWRTQVYRGRWGYPQRWVRVVLVGASFVGIYFSGVPAFSLEAATSLLVLAFALKLIEMKSRRDAYLVIFLSYFVIATEFLFEQSIGIAAYELVAAIV